MWLKIRLEMLSSVVSWFPPRGVMENDREMTETMGGNDGNDEGETTETTGKPRTGLWLKIRLEMLSSMVLWFPPHGVVGNDREMTETMGGNDGEMTETMGDT